MAKQPCQVDLAHGFSGCLDPEVSVDKGKRVFVAKCRCSGVTGNGEARQTAVKSLQGNLTAYFWPETDMKAFAEPIGGDSMK